MRRLFPFALSHDDGAGSERGRDGGRDHHPETEIVGIQHGGFCRDIVALRIGAGASAGTVTVVSIPFGGRGRTRRVVGVVAIVAVVTFALAGIRDSLSVSAMVSRGALGTAAFIVGRTRADCWLHRQARERIII
jgi:hypothetical protein